MKNPSSNRQRFSRSIFGLIVVVSVSLLMVGCDKSDELLPASNSSSASARQLPNYDIPHMIVQINHVSASGMEPDYRVSLWNTGQVIFEGRSNVSMIGIRVREVELPTVDFIRNMFIASHFFNLPSADPNIDVPYFVETTFIYGGNSKTIVDLNDGVPQITLQLRKKTEALLGIGALVDRNSVSAIRTVSE